MKQTTKKKIAILCLTDPSKGYGHLSRCLFLANSLRNKSKVIFLIKKHQDVIQIIRKQNFSYILVPNVHNYKKDIKFLSKLILSEKFKAVIIDMREFGDKFSRKLNNPNYKTIQIDDAWGRIAYADLIFNVTMIKKYHNYKKIKKNSKLYLGSNYYIADKNFVKHKKNRDEIKKKRKYQLTISLGGSDPNKFTQKVLKAVQNLPNIEIKVILGPFFKKTINLKKLTKKNVKVIRSPKKIWKHFQKSDVVISNGGNTLFELAVLKVPTICIAMYKHQISYTKEFDSKGFAINLGYWKDVEEFQIKKTVIDLLNDLKMRKKMWVKGNIIVDGKGLSRVTSIIDKCLSC